MNANATGTPAAGPGELRLRIASALVLAAGVLVITWLGGWPFRTVWALVAGLIAYEWLVITAGPRPALAGAAVAVAGLLIPLAPHSTPALAGLASLAGITAVIASLLVQNTKLLFACGLVYALALAILVPLLRDLPLIGLGLILWSFAVTWFTDIAAYFTGRALGGPKLMPAVSPKKTWSGAIGGTLAGILGGVAIWAAAPSFGVTPPGSLGAVALASLVASILSQAGDLFESSFKRRFGAKDSGHLIPGHGGFMDRLDGYWAVIVFAGAVLCLARAWN
ncbi:phosphatidate cytidylyltransferase [Bosea caraganae]|uniref:Phosphatidate cytidylyltransferase n=1 Tax=Bosea caraganae TaxID=2763117 RepID=A0A370L557_9HYPH|nr:phosphatidate cytidylyltransferase [Bosea caraganae]RDJ24186.1 phosphatidate cytidylyltransferase [Bosea caraganae]RDJ30227.1 phosphatidate cytidylyltransferase [Bosea caraganae]